jgi:hypothetical protein
MSSLRERAPFQGIVAERVLLFTSGDGSTYDVSVQVGQPVTDPEHSESCLCPFRVLGFPKDHSFVSGGGDSLQALVLGLEVLTSYLEATARAHGGTLTWLGALELGFPILAGSSSSPASSKTDR